MSEIEAFRLRMMNAPRLVVVAYKPGFGGGEKHTGEFICGHWPNPHETKAQIERRLQAATIIAMREARTSAMRKNFGQRPDPTGEKVARPRVRRNRPLTAEESKKALAWMRKQKLAPELEKHRIDLCAQAWLELREPPASSPEGLPFAQELINAWRRAGMRIAKETATAWALPSPSEYDSGGQKRTHTTDRGGSAYKPDDYD